MTTTTEASGAVSSQSSWRNKPSQRAREENRITTSLTRVMERARFTNADDRAAYVELAQTMVNDVYAVGGPNLMLRAMMAERAAHGFVQAHALERVARPTRAQQAALRAANAQFMEASRRLVLATPAGADPRASVLTHTLNAVYRVVDSAADALVPPGADAETLELLDELTDTVKVRLAESFVGPAQEATA